MTKPTAASIEASTKLTGLQRQYVKAVADEAAAIAANSLRGVLVDLITNRPQYDDTEMVVRLSRLERRYNEDDKFALTRPKIIALMEKLGME